MLTSTKAPTGQPTLLTICTAQHEVEGSSGVQFASLHATVPGR